MIPGKHLTTSGIYFMWRWLPAVMWSSLASEQITWRGILSNGCPKDSQGKGLRVLPGLFKREPQCLQRGHVNEEMKLFSQNWTHCLSSFCIPLLIKKVLPFLISYWSQTWLLDKWAPQDWEYWIHSEPPEWTHSKKSRVWLASAHHSRVDLHRQHLYSGQ